MSYHHTIMDEIRPISTCNHAWKKTHHHKQPCIENIFHSIILFIFRTTLTPTFVVGAKPAHMSYNTQTAPHHHMHACGNLFEFSVFKMFYLLNKKSDWRSVFIIKSLATRSSKLDLISIYFDKIFLVKSCHVYCTWIAMMFTLKLPWYVSAIFFYI